MKIIHLVSAKEWGGAEVYAISLAKEQVAHGHEVEIICADRPVVVKKFRDAGFKVTTMQINGHLNLLSPIRIALMSRCKRGEKTVIHVHRFCDNLLAAKAMRLLPAGQRPALVSTMHIIEPAPTDRRYNRLYKIIGRIIFISYKSRKGFLETSPAIDAKKLTVIHNSISTPSKASAEPRRAPAKSRKTSLCYVGRAYREKGIHTLISALPSIPGATLTICGTGEQRYLDELHDLASRLGVGESIHWVGFTDKADEYMSKADIGVVPSSWAEPFGLVILEFMSKAIPVVTTDNGAQPEIITDGVDGLLVPPERPDALAAAVNRLAQDPALREKIGNAARDTFERRFTYDKFYARIMDAYDSAFADRN